MIHNSDRSIPVLCDNERGVRTDCQGELVLNLRPENHIIRSQLLFQGRIRAAKPYIVLGTASSVHPCIQRINRSSSFQPIKYSTSHTLRDVEAVSED